MKARPSIPLNSELEQERQQDFYIKPDGWTIDPGAAAVNGLTIEKLERDGVPISQVLDIWEAAIKEGRIAVAFNAQFDTKCLRAELRRSGRDDLFEQTPNICTMRELVGVCKISRMQPGGGYKFPKLAEACAYFKIAQGEQHTATDDNRCNAELLRKLKWLNLMPEPRVHFAKNHPMPALPLREALEKSAVPYPHPGITGTEIVEHRTRVLRAMLRPTADEDF